VTFRNLSILCIIALLAACQRSGDWHEAIQAPFMQVDEAYVDSMMVKMSHEEKIGQLIIVKTSLDEDSAEEQLYNWASSGHIGGMILNDQAVDDYIRILNTVQNNAPRPILNGTEQMVSMCNQFSDAPHFPLPASMSAIASDSIHQVVSQLYIQQCKALNIHFAIGPTVNLLDENASAYDYQLFEQEREAMIRRSSRQLNQLQHEKILAVAHNYQDYLPMPNDTTGVLDSLLNRYINLTDNGLSGWKVGEEIYQIDTLDRLFPNFLKDYLYTEIDFGGLLFTELNENISFTKALHAGTDMFIVQDSPKPLFDSLLVYVNEGLLPVGKLNEMVKKVLMAKTWMGIEKPTALNLEAAWAKHLLQYDQYDFIIKNLHEQAVILANNKGLLPFSNTYKRDFRLYQYGDELLKTFTTTGIKPAATKGATA